MRDALGDAVAVVLGNVFYALEEPREWLELCSHVGPTWTAVGWALRHAWMFRQVPLVRRTAA